MKEITDLEIRYSGNAVLAGNLPKEAKEKCLEFWLELRKEEDITHPAIERRMLEYVKTFYYYLPEKEIYCLI